MSPNVQASGGHAEFCGELAASTRPIPARAELRQQRFALLLAEAAPNHHRPPVPRGARDPGPPALRALPRLLSLAIHRLASPSHARSLGATLSG
jgi:hypothetical protein